MMQSFGYDQNVNSGTTASTSPWITIGYFGQAETTNFSSTEADIERMMEDIRKSIERAAMRAASIETLLTIQVRHDRPIPRLVKTFACPTPRRLSQRRTVKATRNWRRQRRRRLARAVP